MTFPTPSMLGKAVVERCNPHVHAIFLDGLYAPDHDGKGFMFHPAPAPTQEDIEAIVERAACRPRRPNPIRQDLLHLSPEPGAGAEYLN